VLVPLFSVFLGIFRESNGSWGHLASTVLWSYLRHSALLMLGVGAMTAVIGVETAWLVTIYDFPGRRLFSWGLVLPLAIPSYILAYIYAALVAHTGPIQRALQLFMEPATTASLRTSLMSLPGAGILMGLVLFPYVYLTTRAFLLRQSEGLLESARIFGKSTWKTFSRVALPMARPGIVAGVTLVLMEVLNEYGAVRYFGVTTLTTGIFRAWSQMGDTPAAIRLSGCLLLFVFFLITLERTQRGRARFDHGSSRFRPLPRIRLTGWKRWSAFLVCAIPLLFGFVVPVLQLLVWATRVTPEFLDPRFLRLTLNSFLLALGAGLLTVSGALLIVFATRLSPTPVLRLWSRVASLGYSIPGVVIAMGVLIPFVWLDRRISRVLLELSGTSVGLILTGTVGALLFAYFVRFLAVAMNPIDAGFRRVCGNLDECSRSLGASPMKSLLRVDIPLLRGTLLSAGLLVFVDVLKELPLTLILRPFNFDTLATRTFQLVMNEEVVRSAPTSLIIILTGTIPVILLSRIIGKPEA
jgi:iron(III) transport system permease protein